MTIGSREHYSVVGDDLASLVRELNFILSRLEDRLDQLEGRRGDSEIFQNLKVYDADGNLVGGFSSD